MTVFLHFLLCLFLLEISREEEWTSRVKYSCECIIIAPTIEIRWFWFQSQGYSRIHCLDDVFVDPKNYKTR